jgi:predicted hydrocarbon binding protein
MVRIRSAACAGRASPDGTTGAFAGGVSSGPGAGGEGFDNATAAAGVLQMVEVKFQIVSDQRDGLLVQAGRIIAAHGFSLVRPQVQRTETGVVLTLVVRGPEATLPALRDEFGSHPMVQSFMSGAPDEDFDAPALPAAPAIANADAATRSSAAASAPPSGDVDKGRVETLLKALVVSYPNVFDPAIATEQEMPAARRETSMHYAGQRLGAWIFKRDFGRGARLPLSDSLKQIVLPGLRQMLKGVEILDGTVRIVGSPFTGLGLHRGASCHFLCGCIEGLLAEATHLGHVRVAETGCANAGAGACTFAIFD